MNESKFNDIMANAQRLMLDEDFNMAVESKAASFAGRKDPSGISNQDLRTYERMAFGNSYGDEKPITMIKPTNNPSDLNDRKYSKLPQAIRESFAKQPPMTGDNIDNTPLGMITKNLSLENREMNTNGNQQVPIPTRNSDGIDYSLIKSIIDESVRRHISEIKESILSENTIKGVKISKGNKIQLLDMSGNLYEGVLTLKRKAK